MNVSCIFVLPNPMSSPDRLATLEARTVCWLGFCFSEMPIIWVGPPPTNSGILGIYKDPSIITITSCGHY